jgi:gas vesicle protein
MSRKAGKIALGLGLLTGTLTGLLFAPQDGKKTRAKIMQGDAKGLLSDLVNMGEEMSGMVSGLMKRPSVKELISKAKDKAADVANIQRSELDGMLKDAHKKADDFKKKIAQYVNEQKKMIEESLPPAKKKAKAPVKKAVLKKKTELKAIPNESAKKPVVKKAALKKAVTKAVTKNVKKKKS